MTQKELKQNNDTSLLSESVLNRIEKITPEARWKFACMNCLVWVAWATSVVFGAVSVAVLVYVGDHARFALFEATHNTPISFFVEVLPYLWVIAFIAMGAFAYFNMRHTKSGYRYPMWQLLISSVLLSVVGGAVLHMFGVGFLIDSQLGKNVSMYTSLERTEERMWQNPKEGRLVGVFKDMDENDELYMFKDRNDKQWSIQTIELRDRDRDLLSSGKTVRVLGIATNNKGAQFHACGVFPWMFDEDISIDDMKQDRKLFVNRMYEHMENGQRLRSLEEEVFQEDLGHAIKEGLCADLSIIKRMKFQ